MSVVLPCEDCALGYDSTLANKCLGPQWSCSRAIRYTWQAVRQIVACLANVLRFCGGARRGPRVPQEIYCARAEAHGPDRSKRLLGLRNTECREEIGAQSALTHLAILGVSVDADISPARMMRGDKS